MVFRLYWVLGFFATACAPEVGYNRSAPVPRLVYVQEDISDQQLQYVRDATEAYNGISGHVAFELRMVRSLSQSGCSIRISFHDDLGSVEYIDPETREPRTLRRLGQFVTNPEQCYGRLYLHTESIADQTIIQHELGHSIGLKHTANPADIMHDRRVGGQSLQSYVRGHVESLSQ